MQNIKKVVVYRGLTLKQKKFADEYIIRKRIWACYELAKRYCMSFDSVPEELDNGILLCSKCHSLQHPEMSKKMFIRGCSDEY